MHVHSAPGFSVVMVEIAKSGTAVGFLGMKWPGPGYQTFVQAQELNTLCDLSSHFISMSPSENPLLIGAAVISSLLVSFLHHARTQ